MTAELAVVNQPGSEAGTFALASLSDQDFNKRLDALKAGRERIAEIQKRLMRPGVDYGKIPGTGDRPTLLKPGAEKLADFYRFAAGMNAQLTQGDGESAPAIIYEVRCTLHLGSLDGPVIATGWGVCSSWEKKYRYRNEWTNGKKQRVPNDDPWEQANTILKIAEKRAFIDAVLRATASSGLFTQDVGDDDVPDRSPRRDPRPMEQPEQGLEDAGGATPVAPPASASQPEEDGARAVPPPAPEQPGRALPGDPVPGESAGPPSSVDEPPAPVLTADQVAQRYAFAAARGWTDEQVDDAAAEATGMLVAQMPAEAWQVFARTTVKGGPVAPQEAPPPPKPGTDEYRALSPIEKAAARAHHAKPPEQATLAEQMGAPA